MLGNASKLARVVNKMASLFGGADADQEQEDSEAREESMAQTEQQLGDYQPIKPGKVMYCYRYTSLLHFTTLHYSVLSTCCDTMI